MNAPPAPGIRALFGVYLLALLTLPWGVSGQDRGSPATEAYFRAVAGHFQVPVEEVDIVSDWDLEAEEIPVVLFISSRAGVAPDALIGLRRQGRSWRDVALQLGLGMRTFHVSLPQDEPLGMLDRVYGEFRTTPPRQWRGVELTDPEIVALVNLRVLSEVAGVPPLRVLRTREEADSFVACFARLIGAPVSGPGRN